MTLTFISEVNKHIHRVLVYKRTLFVFFFLPRTDSEDLSPCTAIASGYYRLQSREKLHAVIFRWSDENTRFYSCTAAVIADQLRATPGLIKQLDSDSGTTLFLLTGTIFAVNSGTSNASVQAMLIKDRDLTVCISSGQVFANELLMQLFQNEFTQRRAG